MPIALVESIRPSSQCAGGVAADPKGERTEKDTHITFGLLVRRVHDIRKLITGRAKVMGGRIPFFVFPFGPPADTAAQQQIRMTGLVMFEAGVMGQSDVGRAVAGVTPDGSRAHSPLF